MQEEIQKISPIKRRILSFAETLGISKREFYTRIGVSRGTLESNTGITEDIMAKFIAEFPDILPEWLLTGDGPMLRNDKKEFDTAIISYDPSIGVPYYDVDFAAGFNLLYNDQTIVPTYNIIFQPFEDAQFWCNVTGRSMEPKLNPGDIIALKEIPSIEDILYGEIYAVVLKNMRTIKIIRKADNPDMLRFVPININNFDEQVFPKNNIEKVFVVMGCISKFS